MNRFQSRLLSALVNLANVVVPGAAPRHREYAAQRTGWSTVTPEAGFILETQSASPNVKHKRSLAR